MESAAERFADERRDVAYWVRRLYRLRLTTTTGGNVSRRAGDARFVITPAGTDKSRIRAEQVAIVDLQGRNLTPGLRPSSEGQMHLRLYQRHPQIGAVVHAHPTTLSAFATAETPIDIDLLCETYALLDPPVTVPYALSGTAELADRVADYAARSCCLLLQNHAVVTTGVNLLQAFERLEVLEEAARVTLITRGLHGVRHLTPEERADLDRLMGRPPRTDS